MEIVTAQSLFRSRECKLKILNETELAVRRGVRFQTGRQRIGDGRLLSAARPRPDPAATRLQDRRVRHVATQQRGL